MDKAVKRAYLQIHLAVLLFGLTAILGDLIKVSALSIVWWSLKPESSEVRLELNKIGLTIRKCERRLSPQSAGRD